MVERTKDHAEAAGGVEKSDGGGMQIGATGQIDAQHYGRSARGRDKLARQSRRATDHGHQHKTQEQATPAR